MNLMVLAAFLLFAEDEDDDDVAGIIGLLLWKGVVEGTAVTLEHR
jgi:hypothetical protein